MGSALLFVSDNVHADVGQVSIMFSGTSAGLVVGAIAFSLIFKRCSGFKPLRSLGKSFLRYFFFGIEHLNLDFAE